MQPRAAGAVTTMCDPSGPGPFSFHTVFSNWSEYDGSFAEKVRLALRNSWIRLRGAQLCCGHPGEPGC